MAEVRSAASDRITLRSESALGAVWFLADTSIPFRFTAPEESLVQARERVSQADAQGFARAARNFAAHAQHVGGVHDLILGDDGHIVYAMATDSDMQRELQLQVMFIDAALEIPRAQLVVLVEGEDERPLGVTLT